MSDRFRSQYVELSDKNRSAINATKSLAQSMSEFLVDGAGPLSREASIAITKLEEAVMWATKHHSNPELQ